MRIRTRHLHWDFRALWLLFEKSVQRLQKDRFNTAAPDFREFRGGLQHSMKVNLLAHHVESSVHVSGCCGNAEGNICKRGHAIFQHDMPSQIRNHRRGFVVIVRAFLSLFLVVDLLALSTLAEIIHFFLSFRFCEAAVIDSELSKQYQRSLLKRRMTSCEWHLIAYKSREVGLAAAPGVSLTL